VWRILEACLIELKRHVSDEDLKVLLSTKRGGIEVVERDTGDQTTDEATPRSHRRKMLTDTCPGRTEAEATVDVAEEDQESAASAVHVLMMVATN
jgi:hypothetical protein